MIPLPTSSDYYSMSYTSVVTPADQEVVSVMEMKKGLKIDYSDEDDLILEYIRAATEFAETYQRRTLVSKTLRTSFNGWPPSFFIPLPNGPIQSISSVQYYDTQGVLSSVDSGSYFLDHLNQGVKFSSSYAYPSLQDGRPGSVVVTYVAGYGTNPQAVPASTRQAVRFLAAHWFANRTPLQPGSSGEVPFTVTALLEAHRLFYR